MILNIFCLNMTSSFFYSKIYAFHFLFGVCFGYWQGSMFTVNRSRKTRHCIFEHLFIWYCHRNATAYYIAVCPDSVQLSLSPSSWYTFVVPIFIWVFELCVAWCMLFLHACLKSIRRQLARLLLNIPCVLMCVLVCMCVHAPMTSKDGSPYIDLLSNQSN